MAREPSVINTKLSALLTILAISFALVIAISTIPVFKFVFAAPSTTYGGVSSSGRCNEGGLHGVNMLRPHYAEITSTVTVTGTVEETRVSHEDVPFDHFSHDRIFHVKLDPRYEGLNSQSNEPRNVTQKQDKTMEMEWEIGIVNDGSTDRFPKEFWPSDGDRVWMAGHYIFDCGHPPPRTELHPPSVVAFTHFEPLKIQTAGPFPILAAKTSIYIHGEGGYYRTPVGGKHYEFDIFLPPRPSPNSRLVTTVIDTPFGGPPPIITGPFIGGGIDHVHVDYDLTSLKPSSSLKVGSHIAAGWTDPPQYNVYHVVKVTFNAITKSPSKFQKALGSISGRLHADHTWEQEWVSVNDQNVVLLNPSNGFKSFSEPDRKTFSPAPSVTTIVAERGLASTINIKTTGWLRSEMDDCFGRFTDPELRNGADVFLAARCAHGNTNPEALGIVNQNYPIANSFDRTVAFGPHSDCSGFNDLLKVSCEFKLDYDIQDISGPIIVNASSRPINQTTSPNPPAPEPSPPEPSPPIPKYTCDPKSIVLQKGAKGPKVVELQTYLTQLGYGELLGKHGPQQVGIDGIFGDDTKRAVIKFQQDHNLKIDGIVGPQTWNALCSSLSSLVPTSGQQQNSDHGSYQESVFMPDKNLVTEEQGNFLHQVQLLQDSTTPGEKSDPTEPEELESDFPAIDFQALANDTRAGLNSNVTNSTLLNESQGVVPPSSNQLINESTPSVKIPSEEQLTSNQSLGAISVPEQGQFCADGSLPDANGLCPDGNPPPSVSPPADNVTNMTQVPSAAGNLTTTTTTTTTTGEVCADGSLPDANRLCPDGNPPPSPPPSVSPPAVNVTNMTQATPENNLTAGTNETTTTTTTTGEVCADGSLPDANGLCPDGNPPPSPPPSVSPPAVNVTNTTQVPSAAGNLTTTTTTTTTPGDVCADGSLPDANGLCPDGNPPPST